MPFSYPPFYGRQALQLDFSVNHFLSSLSPDFQLGGQDLLGSIEGNTGLTDSFILPDHLCQVPRQSKLEKVGATLELHEWDVRSSPEINKEQDQACQMDGQRILCHKK